MHVEYPKEQNFKFDSCNNWIISDLTVLVYCFQEVIQGMHIKQLQDISGIRES